MGEQLRERLQAVDLCIQEAEWDRAEDGLLDVLSEVRKRQAEEARA